MENFQRHMFAAMVILFSRTMPVTSQDSAASNSADPCCSGVQTQYGENFIYQLTSLDLRQYRDVNFRCRHHVCALDRSTTFGVLYFGGEGMASVDMFSCDSQSERVENGTAVLQPSTRRMLAGPCLCLNVEILGHNVSSQVGDLQPNNTRLVTLASFSSGNTSNDRADGNDVGDGNQSQKLPINVAYTCSSSETVTREPGLGLVITTTLNHIEASLEAHNTTEHPLNITDNDVNKTTNTLAFSMEKSPKSTSTTVATEQHFLENTAPCAGCSERPAAGSARSRDSVIEEEDRINLIGWIVAVGVCGFVILCLLVFAACLLIFQYRENAKRHQLSKTPLVLRPALNQEQAGAYQNQMFPPQPRSDLSLATKVGYNQSETEFRNGRGDAVMTSFGDIQSRSKREAAMSRMAQADIFTLDLSHRSLRDEKFQKRATDASTSTEFLELDGSEFSDEDFFFDDFDDFYLNESVI